MQPPSLALDRPVALVGMMGSGKTIVGRLLAARLGLAFHDSDEAVEREAGCIVADLFANDGEPAFRARERRVIAALLEQKPIILATGGGAMADPPSCALLLERAVTIWLEAEPEILLERLAAGPLRPLLAVEPLPMLRHLLAKRRPAYEQASIRIRTDQVSPAQVCEQAVAALAGRFRPG